MLMNGSRVSIQRTTSSVIEVSCARPWIRSWPTMRFYNVVVTKIYGTRRKGCNKIQPLGIVMAGETLLLSLRFLSICSTSYFRFGEAVNHPIFTISNYILKRDKNQSWTLSLSLSAFVVSIICLRINSIVYFLMHDHFLYIGDIQRG